MPNEIGAADVAPPIDLLCKEFNHGYYYKPVSERAKAYFTQSGFISLKFPGWPGFNTAPAELARQMNLPNLKIKMCETTENPGTRSQHPSVRLAESSDTDPDGPPVGLPAREPHRYETLGFVPHTFGEHIGGY